MSENHFQKLVDLTAHLRGPEGCPWDREQTYDTMKGLLLEEAYEVIDAVERGDFGGLEEELGDLLFQVIFYSRLAEEDRHFDINGVLRHLHAKLVRRHPHVFGEQKARTAGEALASWMAAKQGERKTEVIGATRPSLLDGMARSLPATLECHEIGQRASDNGFDWEKPVDVLDKIEEEVRELRQALAEGGSDTRQAEEELGDLLFAAGNLARHLKTDPESCWRRANQKFKARFRALENAVAASGRSVRECKLEELESIWQKIKETKAG